MGERRGLHLFTAGGGQEALEFIKQSRFDLRELRVVHLAADWLRVFDVNGDYVEIQGVGYPDPAAITLLWAVNAAFDPDTVSTPTDLEFKEYATGRRWAWGEDRVS